VALRVADELGWLDRDAPRSAGIAVPGIALGAYGTADSGQGNCTIKAQ
jgi:hypothetical protein